MAIQEIDVDELDRRRDAGTTVVDVRQPDEWAEARVPGAVLVPLGDLADRLDELPRGETLAVICRSGGRSMRACEFLVGAGFDAVNVAGGTLAWIESGRGVDSGPAGA